MKFRAEVIAEWIIPVILEAANEQEARSKIRNNLAESGDPSFHGSRIASLTSFEEGSADG